VADDVLIRINARDNASTVIGNVNKALGKLGGGTAKATGSVSKYGRALGGISKGGRFAAKSLFSVKGAVVGLASVLSIQKVIAYGDAWTQTANRLRLVQKETESLNSTTEKLFRLAQDSRSEFNATAGLYGRLARVSARLNMSQEDLFTVTETVGKAFTISGAGAQEMQAAVIQLGQGLASARLSGDELRSVLEQAPRLAQAIAEGMGVHVGELRKLGSTGKLTGEAVIKSILSQSSQIRSEFATTTGTVSQGMVKINNAIQRFVGHLDMQLKFTEEIRERLQIITDFITFEVTAAIAVIPQSLALLGEAFELLKDIATQVFMKVFTDPIGMVGDLMKWIITSFGTAFSTVFKIIKIWDRAVFGPEGLINNGFRYVFKILQTDWMFILETMGYAVKRLLLHPIDVAFKQLLLSLGDGISVFNEDWGNSVKEWAEETMKSTLALGESLKMPEMSEEGKRATREYAQQFLDLGATVDETVVTIGEGAAKVAIDYGNTVLGITDEQKAALEALGDKGRAIIELYRKEVQKAKDAFAKAGKVWADVEAPVEAAGLLRRAWEAVGRVIGTIGGEVLKGFDAGLKEYIKSIDSFADSVAVSTAAWLGTIEGGFKDGLAVLIFGGEEQKEVKENLERVEQLFGTTVTQITETLAQIDPSGAAFATQIESLRRPLLEFAEDESLPQKLRDKAQEISDNIALIGTKFTAAEVAAQIDALVDAIEGEQGLRGRLAGLGSNIKDAIVKGFEDATVSVLSETAMGALTQFGSGAIDVALGRGDEIAENVKTGMIQKWGISTFDFLGTMLSRTVGEMAGRFRSIGAAISDELHEGGRLEWLSKAFTWIATHIASALSPLVTPLMDIGKRIVRHIGDGSKVEGRVMGDTIAERVAGGVYSYDWETLGSDSGLSVIGGFSKGAWASAGRESTKDISNEWVAVDWTKVGDDAASGVGRGFLDQDWENFGNSGSSQVGKGFLDQDWDLFGTTGSSQISSAIDAFDWSSVSETQVDKLGSGWGLGLRKNDLGGEAVGSITNSIGAKASDLQASGVGAFGNINTGIRTAANGITPDTDQAVESFGDRLGRNLGTAIGTAVSYYIAGRAFAEVLDQITGIEVPEPIVKGIGLGAGVMKLFGEDMGDSLKGLFDEGGALAGIFGEGFAGMGAAAAIALAAAFTAQFLPDMKKIIGGVLGGDMGDMITGLTGFLKKNADVLNKITLGAIDVTGFFEIGKKDPGQTAFDEANKAAREYSRREGVSGEELFETALSTRNIGLLAAAPDEEGRTSMIKSLRFIEDPALVNKMAERVELAFGNLIAELFAKAVGATGAADRQEAQTALGRAIMAQGGTESMAQSLGIGKSTFLGTGGFLDVPEADQSYTPQGPPTDARGGTLPGNRSANRNVFTSIGDAVDAFVSNGLPSFSLSQIKGARRSAFLEPALSRLMGGLGPDGAMVANLLTRFADDPKWYHSDFLSNSNSSLSRLDTDVTLRARHGAVVPGPPSRATGAIVHGGERILSREEQNAQGGVSISNTFVINGNGDDELLRLIEASMPRIQSQIENTLTKRSRFGQFSIDSRAIRTVLTD
jgi:tape measure domain-containing protein